MTATKAKIVEVKSSTVWNNPQNWQKVYYSELVLDNKQTISLGKTKENYFKVGDEVTYTSYQDANGKTKFKEINENTPKRSYSTGFSNKQVALLAATNVTEARHSLEETFALAEQYLAWLNKDAASS